MITHAVMVQLLTNNSNKFTRRNGSSSGQSSVGSENLVEFIGKQIVFTLKSH